MHRPARALITAGVTAALVATGAMEPAPADAQSRASLERQIASLKRERRTLRITVGRAERRARFYRGRADRYANRLRQASGQPTTQVVPTGAALTAERDALAGELATVRGSLEATTAANNALLAGLPTAIQAVPLERFFELVLYPARTRWPCDSSYVDGAYVSIDFRSRNSC